MCPCCFAVVRRSFPTSTIFISSIPSLCAMIEHLACFVSAVAFTWRLVKAPVAQTSREVTRDSRRATTRACDLRWVLNAIDFKKIHELLPKGAALFRAMFRLMFQDSLEWAVPLWPNVIDLTFSPWVWLPLCLCFHGGVVGFAQLMGLKLNTSANSMPSLCARSALNFALQI